MAIVYDDIIREAALRVGAVVGVTAAEKTTSLAVSPLTAAQIGSVEFPFTSFQRGTVSAVGRIVRTFAMVKNHPFRRYAAGVTGNIAHEGGIPSVTALSKPIIGMYGNVRDATTDEILTEQPKQIIRSILRSKADSTLKRDYFYYALQDGIIEHTRENVKLQVCAFSFADEIAKFASNGSPPIPDACFDIAFMGLLAFLFTDTGYIQQAGMCENYVQNELSKMANGETEFSPAPTFSLTKAAAD